MILQKIKQTWKKLSEFGNHHYQSDEDIKSNEITNGVLLIAIISSIVFLIVTAILIIIFLNIDYDKYKYYPIAYFLISIINFSVLTGCYYLKNRFGKISLFQFVAYFELLVFLSIVSLFLGKETGIQIFLFSLLAAPFLFANVTWKLITFFETICISTIIFIFYLLFNYSPLYPPPKSIADLLFFVITGFFSLAILSLSFYFMVEIFIYAKNKRPLVFSQQVRHSGGYAAKRG